MGYGLGVFAPGRCSDRTRCPEGDSTIESYIAAHNMLNAHSAAVALYRRKYQGNQKGVIGITLNQDWAEPLTDSAEDIAAAERRIEFQLGWFADPILFGDYPLSMKRLVGLRLPPFTEAQKLRLKGSLDFLGLNHYSTKYYFERNPSSIVNGVIHSINITTVEEGMKIGGWAADQMNYETKFNLNGTLVGEQAASSWLNMVPWGFYKTVMWVHHRYSSLYPGSAKKQAGIPIIITENGCDAPGESEKPLLEALNDTYRASYLQQYIDELHHAITDGANIQGYFAWSMLDNFEWADGYSMRFGLYYVDYSSPNRTRYAKNSAKWYRDFVRHQLLRDDYWSWWDYLTQALTQSIDRTMEQKLPNLFPDL